MHIQQQMPVPTCWGWREAQQKVKERWFERISCDVEGVYAIGLCISRFLSKKVYFHVKKDNWDQHRPSNSPRAPSVMTYSRLVVLTHGRMPELTWRGLYYFCIERIVSTTTPTPLAGIRLNPSWSNFARNFLAPSQPRPATSALPANFANSTRRLVRYLEPAVEKKPKVEIDLRVEGVSQDAVSQDEEKMKETTSSWKSWELDHAHHPFVSICRKKIWSSVKNQVALSTRWATWSWSNWDKPRRLFSVLLARSTYQRDWTCVNAASGFNPIKVRWTESEQHLQRWKFLTTVPQ